MLAKINFMSSELLTAGQKGYLAYGESVGWVNHIGKTMPDWDELPENIRKAWEDAANAIENNYANEKLQEVEQFLESNGDDDEDNQEFKNEFVTNQINILEKLQSKILMNYLSMTSEEMLNYQKAISYAVTAANNVHGI